MANDAKFNFYLNRQGPRGQKGEKGDQGFSPSITVNSDTADEYTLLIQNEYDSFVTDNIRPTYDDRGGTYVRVDRANNVQYFGSADIATTANYGEVKLAQASDLASTVDVGNSNVVTAELLKTWFDGQLADNLVTTTNNVTIQGQKVFATPTRFMDTVRIGNRLMVTQDDTGTITFDTDETGTLIGTDTTFKKDVRVYGDAGIDGNLRVSGVAGLHGNASIFGALDVKNGLTVQTGDIKVQGGNLDVTGYNTITGNLLLSPGSLKRVKGFSGYLLADTSAILPEEFIAVGDERLPLRLVGTKVLANGKDVATADTVEAMQSDLNIAKQDIVEAQGDIDNLQMNKQNKLTAGSGITIDADNVISATGGVVDLPIASSTTLGGIKVGENLTISEDGTLSATGGGAGDVSAAGNNTFTGENTFNGAVNLNGVSIAENLTVTRNLTSNGEINAVSIKTTGLRSDDIKTTADKKYLTEVDVDNQTIQVVNGKVSSTTPITYLTRAEYDALETKDANTMYVITDEEGGGGSGGGTSIDDSTTSSTSTWSSSKINSEINTVSNEVVQVQGHVASLDELTSTMSSTINQKTTLQQGTQFTLNLTGNGTLGGSTPACTGSSYETGHPYYYAFKGATSSTPTKELWGPSSSANNQYLILDCVTPIALQSFRWTNGSNSQERFPTIVFKGSNDNSSYTTLGTYNTQNATDDSVTIENYTPYRYYRFDFPQAASWGKIGFISMSGFNRYNILNIGDGLDVTNGQLNCTPSDAPILDVPVNNCVLAMPTAPTFDGTNVKVYAGTKVAIPNGLNADGTCKSNIVTLTADATINQSTFNGDVTLMLKSDGTIDQTAYSYFEVDDISTITTLTAYCWYYDRKTNNHYLASSEGAKQGPYQRIKIGSYNQASTTSAGGKENALRYFKYETPLSLHKESAFNLLPDYTKPSTFTNNVIIVADRDYWICGQFNVDTAQNSVINFYSSGGTVKATYDLCSGSASTNRRFHNIPIPKGTIYMISCTNASFNAKIFPCIGGVNG